MAELTIILVVGVILLIGLNYLVSILPKKKQVQVTFIPPAAAPVASSDFSSRIDAQIQSVNVKIMQLFSRVEELEKRMQDMENPSAQNADWIETVPVRNKKR